MKKFAVALFSSLVLFITAGECQPIYRPTAPFGVDPGSVYTATINFTGSAQTITFTQPSSIITVFVEPSSSNAYVNFNPGVTCTGAANGFLIPTGVGFVFEMNPATPTISVLGTGSTGSFTVCGH